LGGAFYFHQTGVRDREDPPESGRGGCRPTPAAAAATTTAAAAAAFAAAATTTTTSPTTTVSTICGEEECKRLSDD